MKRTSKELKRIARDILNDRYRVPMAAFAATTLIATVIESPFSFSMGDNPTNMRACDLTDRRASHICCLFCVRMRRGKDPSVHDTRK